MAKKKKSKPATKKSTSKTKAASKKKPSPKRKAAPKKKKAAKPRGTARMVTAAAGAPPPYKCERTLVPGVCLKFNRNPATGQYNLPPGGIRVDCSECEYFFEGTGG